MPIVTFDTINGFVVFVWSPNKICPMCDISSFPLLEFVTNLSQRLPSHRTIFLYLVKQRMILSKVVYFILPLIQMIMNNGDNKIWPGRDEKRWKRWKWTMCDISSFPQNLSTMSGRKKSDEKITISEPIWLKFCMEVPNTPGF